MGYTWTAAAEAFAEEIREHGFAAAAVVASAWRAGVDPDATRSLLAAAAVLTQGAAVAHAWYLAPPFPDKESFLSAAEETEGDVAAALQYARDMARDCGSVMDAAAEDHEQAAQDAARAAGSGTGTAPAALAAAKERMAAALEVLADCDAALEVLSAAGEALSEARQALSRVPAEFEETYEEPLRFVAAGRKLPWDGAFITPGPAETTRSDAA